MARQKDVVKTSCVMELLNLAGEISPMEAKKFGLTENLVFQIQSLTNREMSRLIRIHSQDIVDVKINVSVLENLVDKMKSLEQINKQETEFLRLGASTPLMTKLFGMQNAEVTALRKAIGLKCDSGGRPSCSIEQRLDILSIWDDCSQLSEKQKYLEVAKVTKIPLKIIHMVVIQGASQSVSHCRASEHEPSCHLPRG